MTLMCWAAGGLSTRLSCKDLRLAVDPANIRRRWAHASKRASMQSLRGWLLQRDQVIE